MLQAADVPQGLAALVGACHDYLGELLALHQEALIERDLPLALELWQLHAAMLRGHIDLEDRVLLTAHARWVEEPAWATRVYRGEHRKILTMGEALGRRVAVADPGRRAVIALLESERSFKHLLEHHEDREEQGLLPELESAAPGAELAVLDALCRPCWLEQMAGQAGGLERLRARLGAALAPSPGSSARGAREEGA